MRSSRLVLLTAATLLLTALVVPCRAARAQASKVMASDADMLNNPGGVQLLHLLKGTPVYVGPAQGEWVPATIDGWIISNALHDDTRGGFDLSVSLAGGTTLRKAAGGAPLASVRLGALFKRIEAKDGWTRVRRTGWIPVAAVAASSANSSPAAHAAPPSPQRVAAPPPPPPQRAVPPPPAPAPVPTTSVVAGATLSSEPEGAVLTTLESPMRADVLEHRTGWTHVRFDAWVRDASLSTQAPGGITGADVRAAPDKYVGQTVEWTIEVLGIAEADELRPELPAGQPYLLARGPLPETGFLYVAITKEEADTLHRLEPLARIRIRATIRAGRSRFLPTPVLNFVRRLD